MPNSDDKRQIAETFLSGLCTRDWVLLRTIMTQDIVWTLPGLSRISGEARGIEAVIERSQIIVSLRTDLPVEPHSRRPTRARSFPA